MDKLVDLGKVTEETKQVGTKAPSDGKIPFSKP